MSLTNKEPEIKHIKSLMEFIKDKDTKALRPSNFEQFVKTGQYQPLTIPDRQSNNGTKILIITGCGRSGTTLLFNLIKNEKILALDEPRELYLNAWGPEFDIWSSKSEERNSSIIPNKVKALSLPVLKYLEKMPEHIFRINELR